MIWDTIFRMISLMAAIIIITTVSMYAFFGYEPSCDNVLYESLHRYVCHGIPK